MRVAELMTLNPQIVTPDDSIRHAAELMDRLDVGSLPVCTGDRLVGVVTDRDITVRATAVGSPPDSTNIAEVMSGSVTWVSQDDDIATAEELMSKAQVRRLPVVDANKHLIGMLALGDIAVAGERGIAATLEEVSQPGHPATG